MSWRAQISRSIQELRFVACDTSQSSHGLRCAAALTHNLQCWLRCELTNGPICVCWEPRSTFFRKNYGELKMLNPRTPFVYREAEEMEPFVYARYGAWRSGGGESSWK